MIEWNQIDNRLGGIGKDRAWLAEQTEYSPDTIRTALAPASIKRSGRMLSAFSRAIEDEESRKGDEAATIANQSPDDVIVLRVDETRYAAYNKASMAEGLSLKEWVINILNEAATDVLTRDAAATEATGSNAAPNPIESPFPKDTNSGSA